MHLEITNWITIPVDNRQRAGNFYSQVLKLNTVEHPDETTRVLYFPDLVNGGYCGNLIDRVADTETTQPTLIYIYAFGEVDDVAERISAAGGHVLSVKTNVYPEDGVFIIFEDTESNKVAFVGLRSADAQKHTA